MGNDSNPQNQYNFYPRDHQDPSYSLSYNSGMGAYPGIGHAHNAGSKSSNVSLASSQSDYPFYRTVLAFQTQWCQICPTIASRWAYSRLITRQALFLGLMVACPAPRLLLRHLKCTIHFHLLSLDQTHLETAYITTQTAAVRIPLPLRAVIVLFIAPRDITLRLHQLVHQDADVVALTTQTTKTWAQQLWTMSISHTPGRKRLGVKG